MYGQMTAGSWIYIGSQGIVQGTYETFAELGGATTAAASPGKWILTAGLGGMGGAQPLAATMAGASLLAIECQPSRIEMRLQDRLPRRPGERPRRGARHDRARLPRAKADLGRRARQRRGDPAGAGAARRQARRGHRPDLGARSRSTAICRRAGRSPNGRRGARAIRRASSARPRQSMARARARHARVLAARRADLRLRQQYPPDGQGDGRRRRVRFPGLRAGLYPSAVLPRHRAVPLGGAVG